MPRSLHAESASSSSLNRTSKRVRAIASSARSASKPRANSTAALRRVKEVEATLEAELAKVRADGDARLARLREETDAIVRAAASEDDRVREGTLAGARAAIEEEAEKIVSDGEAEAKRLAGRTTRDLGAIRSKLLATVLAGFHEDDSD